LPVKCCVVMQNTGAHTSTNTQSDRKRGGERGGRDREGEGGGEGRGAVVVSSTFSYCRVINHDTNKKLNATMW
jgi:hypothetical protein